MPNKATSTAFPREDLKGALMESSPNFQGIALEIFPPFEVPNVAGNFPSIPVEAMRSRARTRRTPKSGYNRTDWKFGSGSYACEEHGHEEVRDDHEAAIYADIFDYEMVLTTRGRNVLALEQEIRVKDLCHDTSTFAGATNTLAITHEWDDATNAVPIDDIQFGIEAIKGKCGILADGLQIPWQSWFDLWRCSQILERLKYTTAMNTPDMMDMAARAALAKVLGVKKLSLAGESLYNTANEGQSASLSDVWSNEYAFLYVSAKTRDIQEPCIGRTLYYEGDGGLFTAEQYRDEKSRGDVYRVRQVVQEKRLLTSCGFLFSNVFTA